MRQYSHRMDALIQQLFADAGSLTQSVAVFALGGYGRRELCLHSDVDLLILFAGVDRRRRRALPARVPQPALGSGPDHRPSRPRSATKAAGLEADNSEFLLALTDARSVVGDATLLDQFLGVGGRGASSQCATLDALKALIAERHARYNDTLYQLEPDVKESPGGLRDLFGAQTIAKLTDPRCCRQGGSGARALEDAEEFLLRVRSVLHLEDRPSPQRPQPRTAGAGGGVSRLRRRHAAAARRALHGRLLPPRRARSIARCAGRCGRRRCRWRQPGAGGRRHPLRRRTRGGRAARRPGWRCSRPRIEAAARCPTTR